MSNLRAEFVVTRPPDFIDAGGEYEVVELELHGYGFEVALV